VQVDLLPWKRNNPRRAPQQAMSAIAADAPSHFLHPS